MALALLLIARDEEARIGRALASLAGLVDELVVVDTGSRDATREVARAQGARVVDFAWGDDFAAARNFAIAQSRAEWLLWLDADEELLPEGRAELLALLDRPDVLAFEVIREELIDAARPELFSEMSLLRVFRRRPDARLVGRCHAQFQPSYAELAAREGRRVLLSRVRLRHTGFIGARRPEKVRRGLRLLELELAERPGQLYYLIEYGRALLDAGEARGHEVLAEATAMLAELRLAASPPCSVAVLLLEYLIAMPETPARALMPADEAGRLAQRWFPRSAPLLRARALRLAQRGDAAAAVTLLERLREHTAHGELDRSVPYDPRVLGDANTWSLGVFRTQAGDRAGAAHCFEALLASPEYAERARHNLALLASEARSEP